MVRGKKGGRNTETPAGRQNNIAAFFTQQGSFPHQPLESKMVPGTRGRSMEPPAPKQKKQQHSSRRSPSPPRSSHKPPKMTATTRRDLDNDTEVSDSGSPAPRVDRPPSPKQQRRKDTPGSSYKGGREGGLSGTLPRAFRPSDPEDKERSSSSSEYEHNDTHAQSNRSQSRPDRAPKKIPPEDEWDWKVYLRSLPTQQDMEKYVSRLEDTYKQETEKLQAEIGQIGHRVEDLEGEVEAIKDKLELQQAAINAQAIQNIEHTLHMDNIENRHRRNNIRIRGIPE